MTIHYHDDGDGYPIVWVHGFPLSSAMWEPQLAIAGYRHIRPDLPGFGGTPADSEAPSMATYARDVLAVMDDAGIERAVIAGLSMGGYVVMEMMRVAPQRFASAMLMDTRETPDTEDGRATRMRQIDDIEKNGTGGVIDSMTPKLAIGEDARRRVRTIMESATAAGMTGALRAMANRIDSAETLRRFDRPALVVVGDHDEITPPRDAERMVTLLPHAELAPIAQAAHAASFERPAQLNPLIAAFLMRHVLRPDHAESL